MELSVYRHEEQHPFHVDITLNATDFVQSVKSSHELDERVRLVQADGRCVLEVVAYVHPKGEVVRDLVGQIGDAGDVAALLGVDHYKSREFVKLVEGGDFDRAARYAGAAQIFDSRIRTRLDAKVSTISKKVGAEMERLTEKAQAKLGDLTESLINQIQYNAERKRDEYRVCMIRTISNNSDYFEKKNAGEIGELRERILGYEAKLDEAKKQIRMLKNAQVLEFARNDGNVGSNSPVAPTVLAEIEEKARDNAFFRESMFGNDL